MDSLKFVVGRDRDIQPHTDRQYLTMHLYFAATTLRLRPARVLCIVPMCLTEAASSHNVSMTVFTQARSEPVVSPPTRNASS